MHLCQKISQKWLEILKNLAERKELLEKAIQTEDFDQRFTLAKEIVAKQIKAVEILKELKRLLKRLSFSPKIFQIWLREAKITEFSERKKTREFIAKEKNPHSSRTLCPIGPDLWAVAVDYEENNQRKAKLFTFQIKDQEIEIKEEIYIPEGKVYSLAYFPSKDLFLISYNYHISALVSLGKLVSFVRKENEEFEIKEFYSVGVVYTIIPLPDNSFVADGYTKIFYFPDIENLENRIEINTEATFAIRATENKGVFYNKRKKLCFRADPSTEETEIVEHGKEIWAISNYLVEEKVLAIGDYFGFVRLIFFDPETGKKELKPEYIVHSDLIRWLHLTKKDDYYYLFSGGQDNTLELTKFDLQGKMVGRPEVLIQADASIDIFFFDLNGNLIAVDEGGKLYVLFTK